MMMSLGVLMDMIEEVHQAERRVCVLTEKLYHEQRQDCGDWAPIEKELEEAKDKVDELRSEILWYE